MKDLNLEYFIVGEGETTLIIETGMGGSYYNWFPFIEKIKNDFTIVVYHRAGYGKSSASNKLRTTENIAVELNGLIEKIGITDKFILLGHSFGGLCAQQYTIIYPEKIKGLILIDSTSFHFQKLYNLNIPVMNSLISLEKLVENNINTSKKSKAELERKFKNLIEEYNLNLPSKEAKKYKELITTPLFFKTKANEFENWGASSKCLKDMGKFPNIPLVVIARDKEVSVQSFIEHDIPNEEAVLYEEVWRELQIELSQMSSKGYLVIASGSDHDIHVDRPDIIIQCLRGFV